MTLFEFIEILSMTYGWRMEVPQKLRCEDGHGRKFCPITYVCIKMTGEYYDIADALAAADKIGLPRSHADEIMLAADGMGHMADRDLLYKVCRVA